MDSVHWFHRGIFPIYIGLCLSEKAWAKTLRRLKVPIDGNPYPDSDGCSTMFESSKGEKCVVVTMKRWENRKTDELVALMAHELVHCKQFVCDSIGEKALSTEAEAYFIEHLLLEMLWAFYKLTGIKFLAEKKQ